MFGLPWRVSFAPAVLLALDCRAVILLRRGSILRLLLCVGIVSPSAVFPLALDCRAVDIGFAVASVCRPFLLALYYPAVGIVPPWVCLRCLGWLC